MKKIFAIVLTTILALVTLVGCSGGGNSITVAVPNDATNEARALLLLQEKGYITLKEGAGITATVRDIAENPKNIQYLRKSNRFWFTKIAVSHKIRREKHDTW